MAELNPKQEEVCLKEIRELIKSLQTRVATEFKGAEKFHKQNDTEQSAFHEGKSEGLKDAVCELEKLYARLTL